MKLSLPAWTMPSATLPEICGIARALGFDAIDVSLFYASALDRTQILEDPEAAAASLLQLGMPIAQYYHVFGASLDDRTASDPNGREANLADLRQVARFCAAARIPSVFVLPGVLLPGQTLAQATREAVETLRRSVEIVAAHAVELTIEPHVRSIVESPDAALALLGQVPGLGLALDYSHFLCLGFTQEACHQLIPHAAHVHLRQARAGRLQERMAYGTINFDTLLSKLVERGYDGWVAPEPVHQDYIDAWNVDVLSEVIALRDLVRRWAPAMTATRTAP